MEFLGLNESMLLITHGFPISNALNFGGEESCLMFNFICQEQNNVCFGASAERPLFPYETAPDRFGNEMNPMKGIKEVGPGQYDNEKHTTFTNFNKIISLKGYVLGARTERRSFSPIQTDGPPPNTYQPSVTSEKTSKRAFKPFNAGATRFNYDNKEEVTPGPGAYEFDVKRNRSVAMAYSFGGETHLIPAVQIKCKVDSNEQCQICNDKIVGDYYVYKNQIVDNKCYQKHFKNQDKYAYSRANFKKTRDCDFIHEHQGTKAAVQKLDGIELRKLKRKEAYLSLYWP